MRNTMSPISSDDGKFHEGNAFTGALGTKVTAEYLNENQDSVIAMSEEILSILTEADIEPNAEQSAQLLEAIKAITGYISPFGISSLASFVLKQRFIDIAEFGVLYSGSDESAKVNACLRWAELNGKTVTGSGDLVIASPLLVRNANSVYAPTLNTICDLCDGWLIGDNGQSFVGSFVVGDIIRKDFYDGGGAIAGDFDYLNSGIVLQAVIGQSLYFGDIKGFEQAIDFNPLGLHDHSGTTQGSAGENRFYGKTIQRNAKGARFRHTGTGTETVGVNKRGWMEGNTISASIFGCDVGVYQEDNALATYTKIIGVIDCAQGKDGQASSTSLDIDSRIENGICADLYFLRQGKFELKNAASHKLSVTPLASGAGMDPKLAIPSNVLENCDFKYFAPNGSTANSHWPWTQSGLTASRETDGSMLFLHNALGAYIQQGIADFSQYSSNYLTIDITGESIAPIASSMLVNIYVYYKDATGTLVNQQSGNRTLTGRTRWSFKIPAGVKNDGAFIRIVNPNPSSLNTYGLRLRMIVAWRGCHHDLPVYIRPQIIPGRDSPTDMYWYAGRMIANCIDPSAASALKLCTVSGTPGTWITLAT